MSKYYRLVKPLDFDKFSTVQNNFYLRFLEKPLNYYRYEIPDEAFDCYDQEEVKYELIPLMRILQKEDYDLERRLTTSPFRYFAVLQLDSISKPITGRESFPFIRAK